LNSQEYIYFLPRIFHAFIETIQTCFRTGLSPIDGKATTVTNGLFHYYSCCNIVAITDGISNTMAMSETAIADGSVTFVPDTINYSVWRAAATRDNGEVQSGL
jgi:hypothetical protein